MDIQSVLKKFNKESKEQSLNLFLNWIMGRVKKHKNTNTNKAAEYTQLALNILFDQQRVDYAFQINDIDIELIPEIDSFIVDVDLEAYYGNSPVIVHIMEKYEGLVGLALYTKEGGDTISSLIKKINDPDILKQVAQQEYVKTKGYPNYDSLYSALKCQLDGSKLDEVLNIFKSSLTNQSFINMKGQHIVNEIMSNQAYDVRQCLAVLLKYETHKGDHIKYYLSMLDDVDHKKSLLLNIDPLKKYGSHAQPALFHAVNQDIRDATKNLLSVSKYTTKMTSYFLSNWQTPSLWAALFVMTYNYISLIPFITFLINPLILCALSMVNSTFGTITLQGSWLHLKEYVCEPNSYSLLHKNLWSFSQAEKNVEPAHQSSEKHIPSAI